MDRFNGQTVLAKPYMDVNWSKGIDQKTGKPIEYNPGKDIQTYSGVANQSPNDPTKNVCPSIYGGNNYGSSRKKVGDFGSFHSSGKPVVRIFSLRYSSSRSP